MNKTELTGAVAARTGLTKKDADKVVNAVFDTIVETLKSGEKVQLVGFGTFETKERCAHKGRNPQTGEDIMIAACKAATFKAGKVLKETVNNK